MSEDKMKYELLKTDIKSNLFRIKALKDFGNVKAGDLGGYIASEENLSQAGSCWVYGDARVSGNAQVSDNAWVYGDAQVSDNAWVYGDARVSDNARVFGYARIFGNARVYGDTVVTKPVISLINVGKHNIMITDTHIAIGCENHPIAHWKKNIKKIGLDNGYSEAEIKKTIYLLKGCGL